MATCRRRLRSSSAAAAARSSVTSVAMQNHSRNVPSSSRKGAARATRVRQLESRRRSRNVIEAGISAFTIRDHFSRALSWSSG